MRHRLVLSAAAALLALATTSRADTITLAPDRDNTLYESVLGNVSNGKGMHLFAGRTSTDALRRAALRFDVAAAIPPGATITAVELRLVVSKTTITAPSPVSVHRLLADWGEGLSDATGEEGEGAFAAPGDVTWLNTFYPGSFWAGAGGDFAPAASATTSIGPVGTYAWSGTAELAADVQQWLDAPQDNHGWVVIGFEGGGQSSKRFNSRENVDAATQPALVIEFQPPASCTGAWTAYGEGLAGAGGFVPLLAGTGCPQIGSAITLELSGALGGATGALFVGLSPDALPFKGGTFLLHDVLHQVFLQLDGQPGAPGAGGFVLPALLPADPLLQGLQVYLQGAWLDGAAPAGASLSNGLVLQIG